MDSWLEMAPPHYVPKKLRGIYGCAWGLLVSRGIGQDKSQACPGRAIAPRRSAGGPMQRAGHGFLAGNGATTLCIQKTPRYLRLRMGPAGESRYRSRPITSMS